MEEEIDYQSQMIFLRQAFSWRKRLIVILLYVGLPSLVLIFTLGFMFQVIYFGIFLGLLRLAFVWNPAYLLVRRALGLNNLPSRLAPPTPLAIIMAGFGLLIAAIIVWGGVYALSQIGFCGQNIYCLFYLILHPNQP